MVCLDRGLSIGEARDAWRYEVTPALWHNLRDVAGEWAGWPEKWLVAEIQRARTDAPDEAVYRARAGSAEDVWIAIERCMALVQSRTREQRATLARDLEWLARHFFDFQPKPYEGRVPSAVRALYPGSFAPIFEPLVVTAAGESLDACRERVARALRDTGEPAP